MAQTRAHKYGRRAIALTGTVGLGMHACHGLVEGIKGIFVFISKLAPHCGTTT
jgi:hypothetical protein